MSADSFLARGWLFNKGEPMKRSTGLSGRFQATGLLSAVACILLTASPANATTIDYTDAAAFQAALSSFSPMDTFDDLSANTQFADQNNVGVPLLRTNGTFQYSVDAPGDALFTTDTAPDIALSTTSPLLNIEFSFSPGINAVGGTFFPTAADFSVIPGVLTFTFNSDPSTIQTFTDPLGTDFIGFISDGDISSLSVGVNVANPDPLNPADIFATVDNFTVGSTPEPQSVLLLLGGLAAGVLQLRRRNAQPKA
jgi:hypothetical protein